MSNTFYGLPLHPLIVHATVVVIPLALLAVALAVQVARIGHSGAQAAWQDTDMSSS